jgi:hypothetical protein
MSKSKTPRKPRSYKIADLPYHKATKRAIKNKQFLASIIENVVDHYSRGYDVFVEDCFGNKTVLAENESDK